MNIKKPPIIVFVEGTSLTPNQGNQTQKIPPMTSVKESKVKSAAGIFLDPIEYKINPKQTKVPWVANKASLILEDKKLKSLIKIITLENIKHIKPATATVVNFGVSFRHLSETENIEKPNAAAIPNIKPGKELSPVFPKAITDKPNAATNIAIQTVNEIFSLKNRNPRRAVINGMAAKHSNVIAAEVLVMDQIKQIIAVARPAPPNNPDNPIFR